MAETNPYLAMSPAERARQKELLEQAMATEGAMLDVVAAASLRWGFNRLKERGKLGASWETVTLQSLPREAILGKAAGISETEVDNLKKKVFASLESSASSR